ncbi:hypothetical protein Tco_0867313, partial [Tanacetum coccineum]
LEETKTRKLKRKDTEIPQSSGPIEPIADEAADEENVPTHYNDPLLSESLTWKILRLLKQGRKIDDIDKDAEATLDVVEKEVSTADPVTTADEVVTTASVKVSAASKTLVSAATTTTTTAITEVDLTLAQALAKLRSVKPKVVVQEPVPTLTPIPLNIKDKGKGKMIEPEKPLKKTKQIRLDKELVFKLQAKQDLFYWDQHYLISTSASYGSPRNTAKCKCLRTTKKDTIPYRGWSILFHPHDEGTSKLRIHTLKDDGQSDQRSEGRNVAVYLEEMIVKSKTD